MDRLAVYLTACEEFTLSFRNMSQIGTILLNLATPFFFTHGPYMYLYPVAFIFREKKKAK